MKSFKLLSVLVAVVASQWVMSCSKDKKADATKPLQQSFQGAEPEVKQAIVTVNTGLRAGNYAEVAKGLDPILARTNLTQQQKHALGVALQQLNQAVGSNPALDTKEMFELRAKMSRVLTSGPRF